MFLSHALTVTLVIPTFISSDAIRPRGRGEKKAIIFAFSAINTLFRFRIIDQLPELDEVIIQKVIFGFAFSFLRSL